MTRALDALRGKRALLVGDFVLDAYVYGETVRVSREAPVLVVRKEREEYRLGGAANVAANLAAVGVATSVVGAVGQDDAGRRLAGMLRACGVDTHGLLATEVTTPQKTRILAGAFGTARQQVLRIDEEPATDIAGPLSVAVSNTVKKQATHTDVVVVSDYGLGTLSAGVIEAVRGLAKQVPVCVDSRGRLAQFAGVTAVKPNLPEAAELVGFPLSDRAAIERAGAAIVTKLDCAACLLTLGQGGMSLFAREAPPAHIPVVGSAEVTDVTGAGDTTLALFAGALAAGLGFANAMRLANVAAGVVVMKVGAATATPDEIEQAAREGGVELLPW